jgi:hypothetical protein
MKQYDELVVNDKPVKPNKYFSGDYVDARNALIPEAEQYADDLFPDTESDKQAHAWNVAFLSKMVQLARGI